MNDLNSLHVYLGCLLYALYHLADNQYYVVYVCSTFLQPKMHRFDVNILFLIQHHYDSNGTTVCYFQ